MSATASFASFGQFGVDFYGAYVDCDDMENQIGIGGGFGFGLTETLSLEYRMFFTDKTLNANLSNEERYSCEMFLFGIAYTPVIPFLEKYQLSWKTSLFAGMIGADFESDSVGDFGDEGIAFSFWTGPHFDLNQYISFYIELGYNYGYFTGELEDVSVKGFQALAGARCTLFGVRDYRDGY